MRKIFVANLKVNQTMGDLGKYIHNLNSLLDENRHVVMCPTYIHIPFYKSEKYEVGSQDISIYDNGSYTGEVSGIQLKASGVNYVIVGHSDRKRLFREDEILINRKIRQALKNDITPIICIGETKEDKMMLKTESVLRQILLSLLKGLSKDDLEKIVIAYEPIWAISTTGGTGLTPTRTEIDETSTFIKDIIKSAYKVHVPVLYGGSVSMKNAHEFKLLQNTDGFLIGGASLDAVNFVELIKELDAEQ